MRRKLCRHANTRTARHRFRYRRSAIAPGHQFVPISVVSGDEFDIALCRQPFINLIAVIRFVTDQSFRRAFEQLASSTCLLAADRYFPENIAVCLCCTRGLLFCLVELAQPGRQRIQI